MCYLGITGYLWGPYTGQQIVDFVDAYHRSKDIEFYLYVNNIFILIESLSYKLVDCKLSIFINKKEYSYEELNNYVIYLYWRKCYV